MLFADFDTDDLENRHLETVKNLVFLSTIIKNNKKFVFLCLINVTEPFQKQKIISTNISSWYLRLCKILRVSKNIFSITVDIGLHCRVWW